MVRGLWSVVLSFESVGSVVRGLSSVVCRPSSLLNMNFKAKALFLSSMQRIILFIILAYLGYQFIFKFLLPVMRATRQVKDQMRGFQSKMEEQQQDFQQPKEEKKKAGDYIDYEEIKGS